MSKHWVRYAMPIMVEVDSDDDQIKRVVALPNEMRPDRDDRGHFMIYDEALVRRHSDRQPYLHASIVAEPRWEHPRFPYGAPVNWPDWFDWEQCFDLTEADDRYAEIHPYDEPQN